MKIRKKIFYIIFYLLVIIPASGRSPHRSLDPSTPTISIKLSNTTQTFDLKNSHLQVGPYFHLFDENHFMKNLLPAGKITFRNRHNSVIGTILAELTEEFLKEILAGKSHHKHMLIVKKKDFDKKLTAGSIIAQFKDYPFIIKLFIETPQSLTLPFEKGFEPWCFFMLGGGTNRHLTGFTRIKNKNYVLKRLAQCPYYKNLIEVPRKWFWLPQNPKWLEITGKHLGSQESLKTKMPATYAIICDYIPIERVFSLKNQADRRIALQLSNYLQQSVDPHINNFVIEKETKKLLLLDTEHFPTMVGYKHPPFCKSYIQWYTHLSSNALRSIYGLTKSERKKLQQKKYHSSVSLR